MGWTKGKRRNDSPDVAALVRGLGSVRAVAKAAGVSPRAVQFWRRGVKRPSLARLQLAIERLMPLTGGGMMFSGQVGEEVLHAGQVFGVSDYSRGINEDREADGGDSS